LNVVLLFLGVEVEKILGGVFIGVGSSMANWLTSSVRSISIDLVCVGTKGIISRSKDGFDLVH